MTYAYEQEGDMILELRPRSPRLALIVGWFVRLLPPRLLKTKKQLEGYPGGFMVVLWCFMVVLWWFYGGFMVVLWWFYGGLMVVLWCFMVV